MRIDRFTSIALGCALLAFAACGGNNNNSGADARVTDSAGSADAPPPDARVQNRAGTLAITQLNLTDPAVAGNGIGGSSISLEVDDLTMGDGGHAAFGTPGAVGGCYVLTFDVGASATHTPHPAVDEGVITLDGSGLAEPGPYHCAFAGGAYRCDGGPLMPKSNMTGTYSTSAGTTTLTATGVTFAATDIGKYLVLSGMPTGYNAAFPIVGVTSGHAVLFTGQAGTAGDVAIPNGAGYTALQGVGPVPGGAQTVDFINLGGASNAITVSLAANTDYPTAVSQMLEPIGKGITLENAGTGCLDCAQPHQFPITAAGGATVSFSCDPTKGSKTATCGEDDAALANEGLVITGSTTDAPLTNLAPYEMPNPVTQYATFTCTFIQGKTGQIPNGAIAAILGTNPTRIETRVFRFGFALYQDADSHNTLNLVAGHGLVGHTDVN